MMVDDNIESCHKVRVCVRKPDDHFEWNYVSIVYSDSEYGETGYESIKKIIGEDKDICLGESITIYNDHFKGI